MGHDRDANRGVFQHVEYHSGRRSGGCGDEIVDGNLLDPAESVNAGTRFLRHHTDRATVAEHDGNPVGSFVDQRHRVRYRVVGFEHHRRVEDEIAAFDEVDRPARRADRQILRKDHDSAPARYGFSHSAAGDRSHVGDYQWDAGTGSVTGRKIDVKAGRQFRPAGNDEDVAVRQVVSRAMSVEKLHVNSHLMQRLRRMDGAHRRGSAAEQSVQFSEPGYGERHGRYH